MIKSLFKSKNKEVASYKLAHDDFFNTLRKKEYYRLDKDQHIYLDYTGGNLYAQSQIDKHFKALKENTFGNPHSTNPTSQLATHRVEEARKRVIDFFNAEDYYCIFTSNASNALKIVGECYPFQDQGHFLLFTDNHNSVNGIREYCKNAGGSFDHVPVNYDDLTVSEETLEQQLRVENKKTKLLAFPAQSNVSGIKHDLSWIKRAKDLGWDVLLDAAAFVPTSKLDLTKYHPDFVSVSFYKIFGYPAGLGCLLIKKTAFPKLQKKWFAGGTVGIATVKEPFHYLINNHERFENGTINYLDIPALSIGFDHIEHITMKRLNERIQSLMDYLFLQLKSLHHDTGESQLTIFGHPERKNTGGTMIMCFKNPDGTKIDYETVESLANKKQISIRSGCFCNPGLDEINSCVTNQEISKYVTNVRDGNLDEMISTIKKLRGAIRVSVGIATTQRDLDAFISFVKSLKNKTITTPLC